MSLEPIRRNSYDDPDRARVQDAAIHSAQTRTEEHLARYAADPRSFGGRYVAADLFKETFDSYAQSRDSRNRYNAPIHNAAAVLSAEQFRRALARPDAAERDTVLLITGIPGAGKTSSVLAGGRLAPNVKAVFEGQLVKSETTFPKVQQVLDAGLRPVIIAVHATPESALRNTLTRFAEEGRGASINTMADIQGGLPAGLKAVHARFGDAVQLRVYDYRDRAQPRELQGWENLPTLQSEGNRERIAERLRGELERIRTAGQLTDAAQRQAEGRAPQRPTGSVESDRDAQHATHGQGRGIPQVDRPVLVLNSSPADGEPAKRLQAAAAFRHELPAQALKAHPELASAYAAVAAIATQADASGLTPDQRQVVIERARENIAAGIEKGRAPELPHQPRHGGERSIDPER